MIPVCFMWLNKEPHGGFWDWGLVKELLNKSDYYFQLCENVPDWVKGFAIVILPGAAHYGKVEKVNREIAKLDKCLIIVTSDEERRLLLSEIEHPNAKVWLAYGQQGDQVDQMLPLGAPDGFEPRRADKRKTAYFKGQTPTFGRKALVQAMDKMKNVEVHTTLGFAQGERSDYSYGLASAKFAPAPHGTVHPDSFRLYEALESGTIPIVQKDAYWNLLEADHLAVEDWSHLPGNIREWMPNWKIETIKRCFGWMWTKRMLSKYLDDDIAEMSGQEAGQTITALIATSPIKGHPSTDIIEETIKSVRDRLPNAEIIVMCDGVRDSQKDYEERYLDYQIELFWLAKKYDFLILRSDEHRHQAGMTAYALQFVDTPQILFMEHDTPLCEEIPFTAISEVVTDDVVDVVRFHFESHILPVHRHLMKGQIKHKGVTFNRTEQWSQRPHLSSTEYYKKILKHHFLTDKNRVKKTMIEDKMHSVCQTKPWSENRVSIYRPKGNIKRSYHLDGRGEDSKFEEDFEL